MFKQIPTPRVLGLTAGAALALGAAPSASAVVVYSTGFDGPDGTQPTGWVVEEGGGLALDGAGAYVKSSGGVARSNYEGLLDDGSASDSITDYTVDADFSISGSTGSDAAVIARYQEGTSFSNDAFYGARFSADGSFDLYSFDPGFGTLATQSVSGYDFGDVWNIELSVNGSAIGATLRDESDIVVGSLGVTDEEITGPGTFGVRPANATVRYLDYSVDVIPEPGSLAIAAAGAGLLLGRGRRRG